MAFLTHAEAVLCGLPVDVVLFACSGAALGKFATTGAGPCGLAIHVITVAQTRLNSRKRDRHINHKHPVLTLYESGKILTEGISLIF